MRVGAEVITSGGANRQREQRGHARVPVGHGPIREDGMQAQPVGIGGRLWSQTQSPAPSATRFGNDTSSTTQPTSVLNGPCNSPGGRLA